MNSKIEKFYYDLAFKKYYNTSNIILNNSIEDCYKNKDSLFLELIANVYDRNVVCETFNKWIDRHNKAANEKWGDLVHIDCIKYVSSDMNIVEYFRNINYLLLINIKLCDEQLISYIYLYCGFDLYFDTFCNNIIINQEKLKRNYDGIITDKDYIKWTLISISDGREFIDNRIFDKKNNKTINICLKKELLNIFHDMIENNMIGKISFRSNDIIEDGLIRDNSLCEAVEKGKIFNLKVTGLCNETKLYSEKNYNNQLWVFKDDNSITFEELLEDFEYYDKDTIVTQMIHLEYFVEDDISYISHIDKENIFYSLDEYNVRLNFKTKGNAKKRIKFFKINNSKIRFDYPCSIIINNSSSKKFEEKNVPFIYYIVRHFFKNKDIVDEYFSKLNTNI